MKPDVSQTLLQATLQRDLGDVSAPASMVEGEDSRVFGFRRGGEDLVVRVNSSAEGFHKDAFARRHFASAELPIPEVITIGALDDGNAYCVSRRIDGVTLQDLTESQLPSVLAPVARVMGAIADSDISMTRGFGPFDGDGVGRFERWRDFLTSIADPRLYDWDAVSSKVDRDRAHQLLDLVGALADRCPETRRLIHGDFGSNNVLTDGERIVGVIDWSEAALGDPLYDVANILFWRPWLTCMEQQARFFEVQRSDLLNHSDRLQCFQLRIGLEEIHQSAAAGNDRMLAWALSRCDDIAVGSSS